MLVARRRADAAADAATGDAAAAGGTASEPRPDAQPGVGDSQP
jgi:hypothetical protein